MRSTRTAEGGLCLASLTTSFRRADIMLQFLDSDNYNYYSRVKMYYGEASGRGRQQEGFLDPRYPVPRSNTISEGAAEIGSQYYTYLRWLKQ